MSASLLAVPDPVRVDAHLLGAICFSLRLLRTAEHCFSLKPGSVIGLSPGEVADLRGWLRASDLGMQTIEYFLSELAAAEAGEGRTPCAPTKGGEGGRE